jgi:hypothetical protein
MQSQKMRQDGRGGGVVDGMLYTNSGCVAVSARLYLFSIYKKLPYSLP